MQKSNEKRTNFCYRGTRKKSLHVEKRENTVKVVLCQINIFCHQLTQNTKTEFSGVTKIYTDFSLVLRFKT